VSTKAIREALGRLAEIDHGCAPGTLTALREVEAIEKAAAVMCKVVYGDTHTIKPAQLLNEACEVMAAIARQKESK
jgi:hypothetical protein